MFGGKADRMLDRSRSDGAILIAIVAGLASPRVVSGQAAVILSSSVAPPSGQVGITVLNLTGAGFPAGDSAGRRDGFVAAVRRRDEVTTPPRR